MRGRRAWLASPIALFFAGAAPAQPAPGPAPTPAPPPAAAPSPAPTPPPATAPAPAPSSQLPVLNSEPEPARAPPPAAPPGYYVEQGGPAAPPPGGPLVYEPPPPRPGAIYEPPPPPMPRHVAPRNSLWLGVRVGWLFPFGSAYASGFQDPITHVIYLGSVPWTDFVHSGPAFELDAGVRLGRNYNVFGLWERTQFTSGSSHYYGDPNGGDSDYFAIGLRASSDADRVGVLTELSLGYRQARARYEDGSQIEMTGGILEGRIGVGVDLRLSELFALQPLVAIGVGSFDRIQRVLPGGGSYDLLGPNDAAGSHGWVSLSVGASVDLFGGN